MSGVTCTKCGFVLDEAVFNRPDWVNCASCNSRLQVVAFPALFRDPATVQSGQAIVMEGEAGCFYHPQKKAVLPCDSCGRFLCALCDVDLNGRHLCPACLESGKKKGGLSSLDNRRTLYDSLALVLALLPVLIWPLTLITAPATIFVSVRYWKAPGSVVRRSKIRFVLAMLIALAQLAGWGILLWMLKYPSHGTR